MLNLTDINQLCNCGVVHAVGRFSNSKMYKDDKQIRGSQWLAVANKVFCFAMCRRNKAPVHINQYRHKTCDVYKHDNLKTNLV